MDTTKLKVRALEQLQDGDLEQAIWAAQDWDTTVDKEPIEQTNALWQKKRRIYIPADMELKVRILEAHCDRMTAGHLEQNMTLELIAWEYTWPGMREFIDEYIRTCDICTRNKTPCCCYHGSLHSIPILKGFSKSVLIDFIVQLLLSQGYHAIYIYRLIYKNTAFHCNKLKCHGRRNSWLISEEHFQEL